MEGFFSKLIMGIDWGDFGAFAIGALAFATFDLSAKALYDTEITKPIYRALNIQDRRIND